MVAWSSRDHSRAVSPPWKPLIPALSAQWVCKACSQTQNQRASIGAALLGPLVGEYLRWEQNKLGSPLEDGRMKDEPQSLRRSRKLLTPMGDVKVDAVLGARQGQLAASSSLQGFAPFVLCSVSAVLVQPKLCSR